MADDSSGISEFLRNEFLDDQNRPQWDELAGTVVGGVFLQFIIGGADFLISIGEAFDSIIGEITAGFSAGVDSLSGSILSATAGVDALDGGLFGLPLNILVLAVSIYLIARALEV